MKNRKWSIYILVMCILLMAMPLTSAAEAAAVEHTFDFGDRVANRQVSIKVYNPGKLNAANTAVNSGNVKEIFAYIGEGTAESDGKVTVEFVPVYDDVWYWITATPESGGAPQTEKVAYISRSGFDKAVAELKGAKGDGTVVGKFFTDPAELDASKADYLPAYIVLGLDKTDIYNDVFISELCTSDIKTEIYKSYERKGADISSNSSTIPAEVKDLFEAAVCEEVLFNLSDADELKKFIGEYEDKLGISDLPVYKNIYDNTEKYSSLTDGMIEALISHKWTAEDKADKNNTFQEILFLNAVQGAALYDKKAEIISDSEDFLLGYDADIAGFNKTSGDKVCLLFSKAFKDNKPESIEEFVEEFNKAVKESSGEEKSSDKGHSSSGGGGSSSSSYSVGSSSTQIIPPKEIPTLPFDDLGDCQWAHEAITALAKEKILNGQPDGRFYPNSKMKREEFVKLIVLAFDMYDENAAAEFDDVQPEDWFYTYVASAAKHGVVQGYDNKFGVGNEISRQDMAVMLMRVLKLKDIALTEENAAVDFADSRLIAEYAAPAVKALSSAGIINGMGDNTFAPADSLTRAQAAKIIYETGRKVNG